MDIKEIESWVKEALSSTDQVYQLVEVCRTVAELERERCAKVADEHVPCGDYYHDEGRCPKAIASEIRGLSL